MKANTHLTDAIEILDPLKVRLDESIKELLADVQILAYILKYTVEELAELSREEIMACIVQEQIEVGTVSVEPVRSNFGKISGLGVEDSVPGEGKIFYDIKFPVYCKSGQIKVIINIEAQRSSNATKLGYHLGNRIVYYLARMISAQKNVEFFKNDYDNIKKVYSIWICMDAAVDGDSIEEFAFMPQLIFGQNEPELNLDKMRAVVIHIRRRTDINESKNKLISMLEVLLSKEGSEVKKRKLAEGYDMKMSVDLERRLGVMCNISDLIVEDAIEEGLAKGMAQGMAQGMEQGLEQGKELVLKKVISNMLQLNKPISEICMLTECDAEYVEAIKQAM